MESISLMGDSLISLINGSSVMTSYRSTAAIVICFNEIIIACLAHGVLGFWGFGVPWGV